MAKDTSVTQKIVKGMAEAFFIFAWADLQEDKGWHFEAGAQIDALAPEDVDPAAHYTAANLRHQLEKKFGVRLSELFDANPGDTTPAKDIQPLDAERWGWYAATQAMGHGVGLFDYGIDLDVPDVEFGFYSLERNYGPWWEES